MYGPTINFKGVPERFHHRMVKTSRALTGHEFTVFYGPQFTGKTHTACHLVYSALWSNPQLTAQFVTGEQFLERVYEAVQEGKSTKKAVAPYIECDLLVFDDYLAAERQWVDPASKRINELFRMRGDSGRRTVITTNIPPTQWERLDKRITSRLSIVENGMCRHVEFPTLENTGLDGLWPSSKEPERALDGQDLYHAIKDKDYARARSILDRCSPSAVNLATHLLDFDNKNVLNDMVRGRL